jgi:regulator of sirC expression with transglutaminase-like and TPR domain
MSENSSVLALVRLIDDPDENIYEHVRSALIDRGPEVIPVLESSWEHEDYGLLFQSRIENLVHDIQLSNTRNRLKEWINASHKDLLEGAIIIAQYQYPNLDEAELRDSLQKIRKDIWLEINAHQTAYEKVRVFNKIFYGKYGFSGNSKNFHSPLNSCINTVLETKKGNPLSLCVLYSIIAQSLDLPIYGVNLPNHFVLAYMDEDNINPFINTNNKHGALFYINAFARGGIFDELEIKEFLKALNKSEIREYFEPCSNSAILLRMITNLINAFQQSGNAEKVRELTDLRDLFDFKL